MALAMAGAISGAAQQPPAGVATPMALADMVEAERAFAAKALVVGWKQAFLEYFSDDAIGFDEGAVGYAKDQIAKAPDPPKDSALVWEPRYGDISGSGELGYLTGPVLNKAAGRPVRHQTYASVWKRQRDGTFKVILDVGVATPRAVPFAPGVQRAPFANRFSGDYDDRTPPLSAADGVLNSALRGSQSGYRGRLAPEARLHRAGVMPLVGEARILAWLAGQPRFALGDSRHAESARSGDLGYTWGTYKLARRAAGAKPEEGFYARVWTRQRDGQWQVALDVLQPQ
jgi:ketosteroid isomerase-like protein